MENQEKVEQVVDTPATDGQEVVDTPIVNGVDDAVKTFTQEEVNNLMRDRVNRSHANTLKHFGVKSYDELDEIVNNSRNWKDQFDKLTLANKDLLRTNIFLKNNIEPERYEDIDVYYKGAGLDLSDENFGDILTKHPEWVRKAPTPITIQTLGKEASEKHVETEDERINRLFFN